MKNAEEWVEESPAFGYESDCGRNEYVEFIRKVQADAVQEASALAYGDTHIQAGIDDLAAWIQSGQKMEWDQWILRHPEV